MARRWCGSPRCAPETCARMHFSWSADRRKHDRTCMPQASPHSVSTSQQTAGSTIGRACLRRVRTAYRRVSRPPEARSDVHASGESTQRIDESADRRKHDRTCMPQASPHSVSTSQQTAGRRTGQRHVRPYSTRRLVVELPVRRRWPGGGVRVTTDQRISSAGSAAGWSGTSSASRRASRARISRAMPAAAGARRATAPPVSRSRPGMAAASRLAVPK
jgi:hypothetical protein